MKVDTNAVYGKRQVGSHWDAKGERGCKVSEHGDPRQGERVKKFRSKTNDVLLQSVEVYGREMRKMGWMKVGAGNGEVGHVDGGKGGKI